MSLPATAAVPARFIVRDEFLNLPFGSTGQLLDYSQYPSMVAISKNTLQPLYKLMVAIHEDFTMNPVVYRTARERQEMCLRVRHYLDHVAGLSDLLISRPYFLRDKHLPVPRIGWLQIVLRADAAYGFTGNEDSVTASILRGKMAAVYQYSRELRDAAISRLSVAVAASREASELGASPLPESRNGDSVASVGSRDEEEDENNVTDAPAGGNA
ncbi:hypothetical protein C8R46DRAFT_1225993 [Mycena filopes]|nr:hypothetical protein C8R46DRAFT_1225993 [Mycena filopes]